MFPYVASGFGALLLLSGSVLLFAKNEEAPTSIDICSLTSSMPTARWLEVRGGLLQLEETIVDFRKDLKRDKTWNVAYYVPLLPADPTKPGQVISPHLGEKRVVVRFEADEFMRRFGDIEKLSPSDRLRQMTIQGEFDPNPLSMGDLKKAVQSEWKIPFDNVLLIREGDRPAGQKEAIVLLIISGLILIWGIKVIRKRYSTKVDPELLTEWSQKDGEYSHRISRSDRSVQKFNQ